MGAFDDLIPQSAPDGGGPFSDLVPKKWKPSGALERMRTHLPEAFYSGGLGGMATSYLRSGGNEEDLAQEFDLQISAAQAAGLPELPEFGAIGGPPKGSKFTQLNPFAGRPIAHAMQLRDELRADADRKRTEFLAEREGQRKRLESMESISDSDMGIGESLVNRAGVGLTYLAGGLPQPENLLVPGAGPLSAPARAGVAQIAKRAAIEGAKQVPLNVAVDPLVQAQEQGLGLRTEYDPFQTALSGLIGAGIGAGARAVPDVFAKLRAGPTPPGEARLRPPSEEAAPEATARATPDEANSFADLIPGAREDILAPRKRIGVEPGHAEAGVAPAGLVRVAGDLPEPRLELPERPVLAPPEEPIRAPVLEPAATPIIPRAGEAPSVEDAAISRVLEARPPERPADFGLREPVPSPVVESAQPLPREILPSQVRPAEVAAQSPEQVRAVQERQAVQDIKGLVPGTKAVKGRAPKSQEIDMDQRLARAMAIVEGVPRATEIRQQPESRRPEHQRVGGQVQAQRVDRQQPPRLPGGGVQAGLRDLQGQAAPQLPQARRALTQPEQARLAQTEVSVPVREAESGKVAHVKERADRALADADERINKLNALWECLHA